MNKKYENILKESGAVFKKSCLILERGEIWPFVGSKKNKVWTGLVVDRYSRKIAGACAGSGNEDIAAGLLKSIHPATRKEAVFYSDFWSSYKEAFPRSRHFSAGKDMGNANHIERFNLTLRQRMSRFGRKILSFSKNMKNHVGNLWNFIHHYNENIAPNLATTT